MRKCIFTAFLAASALSVACQKAPGITGDWIEPVPGMEQAVQGFRLEENGKAVSVNMATLRYERWTREGDLLLLSGVSIGNRQTLTFCDTLKVLKITDDSLVLQNGDRIRRYSRPHDVVPAIKLYPAAKRLRGEVIWGHEAHSFRADGDSAEYWLVDRSGVLTEAYARAVGPNAEPYTPVRAELQVVDKGPSDEGFAADYAGVYEVEKVMTIGSSDGRRFIGNRTWNDLGFRFEAADNRLTVTPSGLEHVNRTEAHDITGYSVVDAEIGDLNGDGCPEVFVYLTSHGSGSYGRLIGYSVNAGKSMSLVSLPAIADDKRTGTGYMGHDVMRMEDSHFCIRFPLYDTAATNVERGGRIREIRYKLVDGEAGRLLAVDTVTEK